MQGPNENGRHGLILKQAGALTPPVNPVEALRRQMAMAVFNGVKEKDVIALTEKLRDMAMSGDLKAMKMYLEMVGAMGQKQAPPAAPADSAALKMMGEVLQDLVDEIRIEKEKRNRKLVVNGDEE